jgi:hypothetical protein
MALSGFLVPFASGALIKRQEIADQYDENAGEIIDAVAPKYNAQLDENQKAIELHNANYNRVANILGIPAAEVASKGGFLVNVQPADVVNHVKTSLGEEFITWLADKDIETIQKEYPDAFQSLFSENYAQAKGALKEKRDWAATNFNRGAIKGVSDLFLGKKDEEPTKVEKAQKFLFGERVTEETGSAYEQAVAQELGDPIRITSDAAAFSLMKEFYADQGKTFDNINDQAFYTWNAIMKWNNRTGENFFALTDERKNEVGNTILPGVGNLTLYNYVENAYLANPVMQKLTADLYTNNPVWLKVQNALVVAYEKGYRKDDGETLSDDITKALKGSTVGDMVTDYNSLLKISQAFDTRFKLVIDQAMDLSKDISGGDPVKQAEIIGKLHTDLGFNDNLIIGDINPDTNSGILETFITPKTAQNPQGTKMYIYRDINGKYWAIPVNPDERTRPPVPLLPGEVEKILNQ